MKKILTPLILLTFFSSVRAQSILRSVTASAGTSAANGSTLLNYTVGEPVVTYITSNGTPTYRLSQGYQQTDSTGLSGIKLIEILANNKVLVSPNPATNTILVTCDLKGHGSINYTIYNTFGQLCFDTDIDNSSGNNPGKRIDVSTLPAGYYLLWVMFSDSGTVQTIPLIIINNY